MRHVRNDIGAMVSPKSDRGTYVVTGFLCIPILQELSNNCTAQALNSLQSSSRMKHVRGLITTDQALRHVFFHSPGSSLNITSQWTAPLLSLYQLRQRRNATGFSRFHRPDPAVKSPVLARQFGPRDSTFPTVDEEISDRVIRVVGENKTLSNPQELKQVLNSFDRKQYFLLQVSPPSNEIPVCKITEKK